MRNDQGRVDQLLGYLGLLLLGTLGWAADHFRLGPTGSLGTTHPFTGHASRRAHA